MNTLIPDLNVSLVVKKLSSRYVNDVLVLLDLFDGLFNAAVIAGELDVNDTSLAALEYDILELLHVPLMLSEDGEYVSKNAHFVVVADDHLVEGLSVELTVHTIFVVNGAECGKLLNDANSFLTNGCL